MMTPYKDISGDSGIVAYEIEGDSITIEFRKGGTYRYDANKPGAGHVSVMKGLAQSGDGLNTYINKNVRKNFAAKLN